MKVTHAILDKEDVNVIVVNWIDGARLTYDQAVSNTRVVGSQIGHLIKNLMVTFILFVLNSSFLCAVFRNTIMLKQMTFTSLASVLVLTLQDLLENL